MASPAQAPHNFNRTHPNHERAHPSGESVGQYHIPTPESVDVPSNGQNTEKEKRSVGRYVAIGVGGVAVTVAGIFGFGKVVGHQTADRITNGVDLSDIPSQAHTADEATPILGDLDGDNVLTQSEANLLSITEYGSLDPMIRANHKNEALNKYLYTAWEDIQSHLTDGERKVLYLPDLDKPREEWTDQDYLNQHALAVWFVSRQPDNTEAQQSFAAITNPDKEGYDDIQDYMMRNPGVGIKNIHEAVTTPLSNIELRNINIGPVELDENGGRFVGHHEIGETKAYYTVYSNQADSKQNLVPVVERTYTSLNHPDIVTAIHKIGR